MELEKYKDMEINNILVRYNDIVITEDELGNCINRYISTLHEPDDIYKNHRSFNGMLLYLYKHLIVYILPSDYFNNYELLNDIFMNIYIPLCYMYNHIPQLSNYCILVNIRYSYLYNIKTGEYVNNGSIVNNKHQDIIKNWLEICNSELVDEVIHKNSIGAMFLAKVHGFREDNATNVNITVNQPMITETQLNSIALTGLPQLPDTEN